MTGYKPYLVAPFSTGQYKSAEPWMAPSDAFPVCTNAYIDSKGALVKRLGKTLFATMKHGSTAQSTTAIMGMGVHLKRGRPKLIICDTKRANLYYAFDGTMTDIAESDIFTGDNRDYFHYCNWLNSLYMTNGKDQIYVYDNSTLSAFNTLITTASGSETNHIDTARFIAVKDNRLLFFDPVEKGTRYPDRCRYSPVSSVDFSASGGGYIDADAQGQSIVAIGTVNKDILAFFRGAQGETGSLYKLQTYGDTNYPFVWVRQKDRPICRAPYSVCNFNSGVGFIDLNGIMFHDGFQLKPLDLERMRDAIEDWDDTKILYSTGHHAPHERCVYFSYCATDSAAPDRLLRYDYVNKTFATFTHDVHCMGTFNNQWVPTAGDLDEAHDDDDALVSDMDVGPMDILGDPHPVTLMGDRNSRIWTINTGGYDGSDDADGTIALDVRSARFNPYTRQGRKAILDKIVFLVDNDEDASATISFYKDMGSTAYTTGTLSCDGDGDKFWTAVHAHGETGAFHRIKISHDARNNRPRIHAMELWMKPGGPIV